jgi:hypothetical protein
MQIWIAKIWLWTRNIILKPLFIGIAVGFGVSVGRAIFLEVKKALENPHTT